MTLRIGSARATTSGAIELHAAQRLTMFNFFVVLSGLVTAGLGATMQGPPRMAASQSVTFSRCRLRSGDRGVTACAHSSTNMSGCRNADMLSHIGVSIETMRGAWLLKLRAWQKARAVGRLLEQLGVWSRHLMVRV